TWQHQEPEGLFKLGKANVINAIQHSRGFVRYFHIYSTGWHLGATTYSLLGWRCSFGRPGAANSWPWLQPWNLYFIVINPAHPGPSKALHAKGCLYLKYPSIESNKLYHFFTNSAV